MKQAITLSNSAAIRIKEIMSKDEKNSLGVRVGVKSGGCAGMSYIMEYAKEINPKKEEFSSNFIFKNPNETERCGCGESFKI